MLIKSNAIRLPRLAFLPGLLLSTMVAAAIPTANAQSARLDSAPAPMDNRTVEGSREADSLAELPESPGAAVVAESSSAAAAAGSGLFAAEVFGEGGAPQQNPPGTPGSPLPRHSSPLDTVVAAGQIAPHQTVSNKMLSSLREPITPFSILGNVVSAGYSHLTNGSPNYGTDGTAFGERFGAAMARGASQSVFSNGVMASVLHQDTRYYQQGSKYSFGHRIIYAATRPLIGRTDSGRTIPNFALLSGYLGAAFLTRAYYPEKNQTVSENLQTYGSSIGGAAIGFGVSEFLPQVLQAVHLKKLSGMAP